MINSNYTLDKLNIKSITDLLQELITVKGISSREEEIAKCLTDKLDEYCDTVSIDMCGNVVGKIFARSSDAKTILLEAHMDQIGLMVTGIDENGFVKFTAVGGVDERVLPSLSVKILGKRILDGVVFTVKGESDKNPKTEDLRIDTALSENELKALVNAGDFVVFDSGFSMLTGTAASGSAMDNRAGVASILETLHRLNKKDLKYNICVLFSVEEELGLHGVYTGIKNLSADFAIVVDVTHGSTPDTKDEVGVFPLGSGAVICRGPNFHYDYTKQLIELAKNISVPYDIEVAPGPSGTDAWAIQISDSGIPSTLISIPLKYMHTNVETLDIKDVDAVSELICAVIKGGITIA